MSTVVVPLWALEIGTAPFLIGIALGARAALSIPFSIHGGALMDRLGPRRIMIASGAGVALLTPLYPILPWIEALIVLQLAVGFFQGFAWMGADFPAVASAVSVFIAVVLLSPAGGAGSPSGLASALRAAASA